MNRHKLDERPALPGSGRVEDYTTAFLWSFGGVLFIGLFAIWAIWGLPVALAAGWLGDKAVQRLIGQSDEA